MASLGFRISFILNQMLLLLYIHYMISARYNTTMMLVLLIVTACLLPSGVQATDCAIGLADEVAAVVDGYRNVLDGVKKRTNFQLKSKRPSFNNAVGDLLQHDLCDLEKLSRNILEECKTCPGCNEMTDDCDFVERDVVILLDSSGSIRNLDLATIKQFGVDLINGLDKGHDVIRVAALFFSRRTQTVFKLDDFIGNLTWAAQELSAFSQVSPGGSNLAEAFYVIRSDILKEEADRKSASDTLVILTDISIESPSATFSEYGELIMAVPDLEVIVVAVSNRIITQFVLARPEGNVFPVGDISALGETTEDVLEKLCTCKACEPSCKNGATCDASTNKCICAPGFFGSRCQSVSVCKQDDPLLN